MKRLLLIGSLSIAAAALTTTPALAQDTLQRAGTVTRTASFQSLLTALAATDSATARIAARTVKPEDIRVIDLKDVLGTNSDDPIDEALDKHKDKIAALRDAIGKNMTYTVALASHKEKPEAKDVIAVDIQADGDVLVYFKK
jgi:hypothetical protein